MRKWIQALRQARLQRTADLDWSTVSNSVGPGTISLVTEIPSCDPTPSPPFFFMTDLQRLAIRYHELTGNFPYETITSRRIETHQSVRSYFFFDGYYTTNDDAAGDHLRFLMDVALLIPPPRHRQED